MAPKPFHLELMWFEEKGLTDLIRSWWSDIEMQGWAGFRLVTKLKKLKANIKEWANFNFGTVKASMKDLLLCIEEIDSKEEMGSLLEGDLNLHQFLQDKFPCKAREEEIKWR